MAVTPPAPRSRCRSCMALRKVQPEAPRCHHPAQKAQRDKADSQGLNFQTSLKPVPHRLSKPAEGFSVNRYSSQQQSRTRGRIGEALPPSGAMADQCQACVAEAMAGKGQGVECSTTDLCLCGSHAAQSRLESAECDSSRQKLLQGPVSLAVLRACLFPCG